MRDLSIYVSAASAEVFRAENAMRLIRERGWRVSGGDWPESIRRHGSQGSSLRDADRVAGWQATVDAVRACDALLLLTPEEPVRTEGAWVEVGIAIGLGRPCVQVAHSPRPRWAVCGVPMVRDIASALYAIEGALR